MDPEHWSGLGQNSAFFSDPDPEPGFCEEPGPDPQALFNFGSCRSLRGHFLSENMGKFRLG